MPIQQSWYRAALIVVTPAILLAVAWWVVAALRFQATLHRALDAMATGRFDVARPLLVRLAELRPGRPEVEYSLGLCEQALGHHDASLAAWARVPSATPFAARAAGGRARVLEDRGRFADAEDVLKMAINASHHEEAELRLALQRLLWYQGRLRDVGHELREQWTRAANPVAVVREHALLDFEAFQFDRVRTMLEASARMAPDDDRVWLGRANLATRSGRYGEAAEWLDACLRRRPVDAAVWRARLDWALARRLTQYCSARVFLSGSFRGNPKKFLKSMIIPLALPLHLAHLVTSRRSPRRGRTQSDSAMPQCPENDGQRSTLMLSKLSDRPKVRLPIQRHSPSRTSVPSLLTR